MAELPVCNICKCSANSEVTHSGNFAFHYNNHCPWAGARMSEEQWTKLMGQGESVTSSCESRLAKAGVFKGAEGLRQFAECQEFWDDQLYGTRLYFGDGHYLHRDVLRAAVMALDAPQQQAPAVDDGVVRDAARYRWLRSNNVGPSQIEKVSDDCNPPYFTLKCENELDAAIDTAIEQVRDDRS